MGRLIGGRWVGADKGWASADGRFNRQEQAFRGWLTADGSPGPNGAPARAAVPGRYHLYVSYACPWAHRTLVFRLLKGLETLIGVSYVHWHMGSEGWTFDADPEGLVGDRLYGSRRLYELYQRADPSFSGRVTVPVLWDRETDSIVNNESSEIIRMLNSAFDFCGAKPGDFYPVALRNEIDAVNARVYATLNNGVYRAGFATTQEAYEEAARPLFETMDWLERRLGAQSWLCGDRVTEADWRLFTTLIRFDAVYYGHFKCNVRRLVDYPELWDYTRALYRQFGIEETVRFDHIKRHYYGSHPQVNPSGVVPIGPELDFSAPTRRCS
jgi:glutathionyl-hydroquinone reductase